MAFEFQKVLVLSTAHVSEKTAKMLDGIIPGRERLPVVFQKGVYGWWVHIDRANGVQPDCPEDLKSLVAFAKAQDCHWLMLDCDGDIVDLFPTYEW